MVASLISLLIVNWKALAPMESVRFMLVIFLMFVFVFMLLYTLPGQSANSTLQGSRRGIELWWVHCRILLWTRNDAQSAQTSQLGGKLREAVPEDWSCSYFCLLRNPDVAFLHDSRLPN